MNFDSIPIFSEPSSGCKNSSNEVGYSIIIKLQLFQNKNQIIVYIHIITGR